MTWSRGAARAFGGVGVMAALALTACQQAAPVATAPREQQQVLSKPAAELSPAEQKYQAALKDFQEKVVPAAEKEGELNWYACQLQEETDRWIKYFNKYYPKITVNHVFGPGPTLVQKIQAEVAAGKVTADTYTCGITSSRSLTSQPNTAFAPEPPSLLNPDVKWNWDPSEGNGLRILWSTNGIAGLEVNTKLVPKDKYPKTWKDLVTDPYWVDLFKRGAIGMADPRASGFGHQLVYGLRVLKADEYGEPFIRQLAALKPVKYIQAANEVERGEHHAHIAAAVSSVNRVNKDPVELVCPDPGCVQSFLAPATIKGPHPNAARVWAEFWLTKEGQEFLRDTSYTINRQDVQVPPELDWKNFKQLYFASEEHDKNTTANLEWNKQSGLWEY